MPSTRSTVSAVTPWPVRMIVTSSSISRSARAISPGLAVQRDLVAADVDVGVERLLDQGEVLVAGAQQADHVDAVGDGHGVMGWWEALVGPRWLLSVMGALGGGLSVR